MHKQDPVITPVTMITAGAVFDYTGGYLGAFVFFAIVVAIGSLLILTAVPPDAE